MAHLLLAPTIGVKHMEPNTEGFGHCKQYIGKIFTYEHIDLWKIGK